EIVEVDKETITSIIRNAKRLDRLASDILDVTRIESKSLKLNKEQFDLSEVLSACILDLREQIENDGSTGRNVKIDYTPSNIVVEADKGRITQVISNLLRNAIKFTSEGVISINAFRKDHHVLSEVHANSQHCCPQGNSEILA